MEKENVNPPATEDIDFEPINEPWSKYRLQDGTIFEIRLILTNIKPDPLNHSPEPMYNYKFNAVPRVVSSKPKVLM